MGKFKLAVLAAALLGAGTASAATQGTLGPTSTATFINTFTGNTAQVRIFGIQDAAMTSASGDVATAGGKRAPGVSDSFCLINSAGSDTKLTFTNTGGGDKKSVWNAVDSAGKKLNYHLMVSTPNGENVAWQDIGTTGLIVSGKNASTNTNGCPKGNNIVKTIYLEGSGSMKGKGSATFTDTMTVIATPQ